MTAIVEKIIYVELRMENDTEYLRVPMIKIRRDLSNVHTMCTNKNLVPVPVRSGRSQPPAHKPMQGRKTPFLRGKTHDGLWSSSFRGRSSSFRSTSWDKRGGGYRARRSTQLLLKLPRHVTSVHEGRQNKTIQSEASKCLQVQRMPKTSTLRVTSVLRVTGG